MIRASIVFLFCAACIVLNAREQKHSFYILFKSNESTPNTKTIENMDSILKVLNSSSHYKIEIQGHTDNIGTTQYNKELSYKRAQSIKEYISNYTSDTADIKVKWFGESNPALENTSESGREINRRVIVNITTFQWETAKEMLEDIAPKPEVFYINSESATEIESISGIKLHIPKDAFEGSNISNGDIKLILTSAINKEDWLVHGLSTISEEGLLESGGMFKIEAYQGTNSLSLKEGKQINVEVPFEKLRNDMAIYNTTLNSNGQLTWKKNDENPISTKGNNIPLPFLKIDSNDLNRIIDKWKTYKFDASQFKYSIIGIPVRPTFRLTPPKAPVKPIKENIKIYFSDAQKRLLNTHSKQKMINREYNRVLRKYTLDSIIFAKRTGAYLRAIEKFRKDSISHEKRYFDAIKKLQQCREMIICKRLTFWQSHYYKILAQRLSKLKKEVSLNLVSNPIFTDAIINERMPPLYQKYRGVAAQSAYHKDMNTVDSLLGFRNTFTTNLKTKRFFQELNQVEKEGIDQVNVLTKLFDDANTTLYRERKAAGISDNMVMHGYYQFALNDLNWINIDRLSKFGLTVKLNITDDIGSLTYVIFEKTNSVIQCYNGKTVLPENENITLVSFSVRDGKPFYAVRAIKTGAEISTIVLEYKPGRITDIKAIIKTAVS